MIVKPEFSDHNKEMLEDLRDGTGSGSISSSIITYCDYGTTYTNLCCTKNKCVII